MKKRLALLLATVFCVAAITGCGGSTTETKANDAANDTVSFFKKLKEDARVLFLYGEKDIFSLPKKSKMLFDACSAKDKKIVWFLEGGHSHLRINNTEKYDNAIIEFFKG